MDNLENRVAKLEEQRDFLSALVCALIDRAVRDSAYNKGAHLDLSSVGLGNVSPHDIKRQLRTQFPNPFPRAI